MDGLRILYNVGWYNVVDTGIVMPLSCLNAFVSFHQWNFPTALFCLLNKLQQQKAATTTKLKQE